MSKIDTVSCTVHGVSRVGKLGLKVLGLGRIPLLEIQSPGNASELVPIRSLDILAMNGGNLSSILESWSNTGAIEFYNTSGRDTSSFQLDEAIYC